MVEVAESDAVNEDGHTEERSVELRNKQISRRKVFKKENAQYKE